MKNLGVFTHDNDYEEPTTRTHRNSSSDSSELKEAEDCEPLVHEKPAILKLKSWSKGSWTAWGRSFTTSVFILTNSG